ncbi:hypothetical protein H9P43_008931 [Blastocladiella emersonii ATCC 22665]|nr:hypothetical protein H9P43_008931 [Blastocladiella emersonii ATCC 22665]
MQRHPATGPDTVSADVLRRALRELSANVQDLCVPASGECLRVRGAPTALEFLRMVRNNQPVVFEGLATDWPALSKWTPEYLTAVMGDRSVTTSFTPTGFADAPLHVAETGTTYFVLPHDVRLPFRDSLAHLLATRAQSPAAPALPSLATADITATHPAVVVASPTPGVPVAYMQTQNGCLSDPGEWAALRATGDVPATLSWADEAMGGAGPDAVNVWFGSAAAATAVHKDPYENLYAVVAGTKVFRLYPPSEAWRMQEEQLVPAHYAPHASGSAAKGLEVGDAFAVVPDADAPSVPWIVAPDADAVCIELFLPSQWYHAVHQVPSDTDVNPLVVAVNWWYDMQYGSAFAHQQLVRALGSVLRTGALPPAPAGLSDSDDSDYNDE